MTLLVFPALIVGLGIGLGLVFWRLGVLASPAVVAWDRVGRNHGLIEDRPITERLGRRAPFVRRFHDAANIPRLLAISGREETATAWVLRTTAISLLALLVTLCADLLGLATRHRLAFPIIDCIVLAGAAFAACYLLLRIAAKRRQAALQAGLSGALTEMAILTYTRQMSIEQSMDLLARAQEDGQLWGLLRDEGWRRLVVLDPSPLIRHRERQFTSAASIYERVGQSYGVPMFTLLASGMRRIDDKGLSPRTVLTNLARSVGANELAEMQVRSEQSKFRQAIPIGLMILPLMLLIGYPAWAALSRAFQ